MVPSSVRSPEVPTATTEPASLRAIQSRPVMLLGHELGSPLSVILAYLRLWQESNAPVDRDELDLVLSQALALKARLDDLVLLDQLESNLQLARERIDVPAVVAAAAQQTAGKFRARKLALEVNPASGMAVQGDKALLQRAVEHVLENACKFSAGGASVQVRVERANNACLISVRDHGIGIPAEQQAHIFEPFYQADPGRARRYGGMGLGLVLVRTIVERHGGAVRLDSRVGEGSTFCMMLPAAE